MASDLRPTALVIDDNPVIRLHLADILDEMGFSVFSAGSGEEAHVHLFEHGRHMALLLANISLPGENGLRFASEAVARWPMTKVVLTSGLVEPDACDLPEGATFLRKPFSDAEVRCRAAVALRSHAREAGVTAR